MPRSHRRPRRQSRASVVARSQRGGNQGSRALAGSSINMNCLATSDCPLGTFAPVKISLTALGNQGQCQGEASAAAKHGIPRTWQRSDCFTPKLHCSAMGSLDLHGMSAHVVTTQRALSCPNRPTARPSPSVPRRQRFTCHPLRVTTADHRLSSSRRWAP